MFFFYCRILSGESLMEIAGILEDFNASNELDFVLIPGLKIAKP